MDFLCRDGSLKKNSLSNWHVQEVKAAHLFSIYLKHCLLFSLIRRTEDQIFPRHKYIYIQFKKTILF